MVVSVTKLCGSKRGVVRSVPPRNLIEGADGDLGEGRLVDVQIELDELAVARRPPVFADTLEQRRICRRVVKRLAFRINGGHTFERQQKPHGSSHTFRRSTMKAPILAFSSGVVRMSVTCALCT